MLDSETMSLIREEVRKQMNIILSGRKGAGGALTEDIEGLFPGMPTITNRPVARPWGFASVAPKGTLQVVARQGEHFGNRVVLGHRASDIPADIEEGESILYDSTGKMIRVKGGEIKIGSSGASENLVLGKVLQTLLSDILSAISTHTHITTAPGSPTTPPANAALFTSKASSPVGDGAILSDIAFVEKTLPCQ